MLIPALEPLVRRLGDLLLGPIARAAERSEDCCAAAILADLRWSAAPGIGQASRVRPGCCKLDP